jgi:ribonuclease Z
VFEVTFLGTAATMPSAERGLPALLVGAGSERYLIDCGEGTQRQLLRAGSGFRRLARVLLTHAHFDHVLGLAGLIATLGLLDLRDELTICGSRQTLTLVERYLSALWPQHAAPIALRLASLNPGPVCAGRDYSISCFPVRHHQTESLGYRFDVISRRHLRADLLIELGVPAGHLRAALANGAAVTLPDGRVVEPSQVEGGSAPGASLAVVGDTQEINSLVEWVRGVDALVIEATFLEADAGLATARGHLTAAQAGRLAATAGVGALYLTHLSGRYEAAAIAAEAQRHFANAKTVTDFDRIAVSAATSER